MQCKCGDEITSSEHSVKTTKGANEWADGFYENDDLPLTIEQKICKSCGRSGFKVYNKNKDIIKNHGL